MNEIAGGAAADLTANPIAAAADPDAEFLANLDGYISGEIVLPCRSAGKVHPKPAAPQPYRGRSFSDEHGTWDEARPGAQPRHGDQIDDEGVIWRLRPVTVDPRKMNPRQAYDHAVEVAAAARNRVEVLAANLAADHPDLIRAREIMHQLADNRLAKLKAFEAWQEAGNDPVLTPVQAWEATRHDRTKQWRAIDAYRQTEAGRLERNASLRTTDRGPNAKLNALTPDELKEHRRQKEAEKKRRQRAKKAAAAAAAA